MRLAARIFAGLGFGSSTASKWHIAAETLRSVMSGAGES
jgi:hypothetical protein